MVAGIKKRRGLRARVENAAPLSLVKLDSSVPVRRWEAAISGERLEAHRHARSCKSMARWLFEMPNNLIAGREIVAQHRLDDQDVLFSFSSSVCRLTHSGFDIL